MDIRALVGKNVCIVGFGREGQAALRGLRRYAPTARITVADTAPVEVPAEIPRQLGPRYLENLERFDVIIKSPGIPPKPEFERVRSRLTSGTQIFLDTVFQHGALVIGVTGTKGKSTTATLIFEVLRAAQKRSFLLGNIGNPALDFLGEATSETIFVQECSSYQLMDLSVSPPIAVITSFFPEHLDYHGSIETYLEAKKHITRFQKDTGWVFYNARWEGARAIAEESPGRKMPFTAADAPLRITETKLLGQHNLSNIAAAWLVTEHLGVPKDTALKVFREFPGLPHRLQSLGYHHGILWVDDSLSTTPESTIAALDAVGDRVVTLILGGHDRDYEFSDLAREIAKREINGVVLFPPSGVRIRAALTAAGFPGDVLETESMGDAVRWVRERARGGVCLLSPASPSYGLFKNFEERGDRFWEAIQ